MGQEASTLRANDNDAIPVNDDSSTDREEGSKRAGVGRNETADEQTQTTDSNSKVLVSPRRLKKRQSDYQVLCRMKKARNEARLKELGFTGTSIPSNPSDPRVSPALQANQDTIHQDSAELHGVSRSFPHREKQIRQLNSLLHRPFPPSPIFVTGPKGAGKSAIVSQLVQQQQYQNAAYLDCSSFFRPLKTAKHDGAILEAIHEHLASYRAMRAITSPWKLHLELLPEEDGPLRRLVVLDHAESLSIDLLQQLFCLPDFSWIVIARSSLVSMSIVGCCPIHVHFNAYEKRDQVRDILLDQQVRRLVAGSDCFMSSFSNKAYVSFVDSLSQANTGSDIRMYIQRGRHLWPRYIAPLHPRNIEKTFKSMDSINKPPTNADVIGHLDQLMLPLWRTSANGKPLKFPKLGKYLLLAGYICQSNHHDTDKSLFSMERNGRRRKTEKIAPQRSSRSSFPLERLFSVYVSIVSLNEKQESAVGDLEFFERMAYLKELGIIQRKGQGWACAISATKASAVAKSLNFALGNYVKTPE